MEDRDAIYQQVEYDNFNYALRPLDDDEIDVLDRDDIIVKYILNDVARWL